MVWIRDAADLRDDGQTKRPEADPEALGLFLQYRYTPSPYTAVRGVRKLAPGTKLVVRTEWSRRVGGIAFRRRPFAPPKSAAEAGEELLALYRQAVRRQLVSDVPVGLLLSGGIDSALLLALMNENGADWPTYSVGYGESYRWTMNWRMRKRQRGF